MLWQEQLLNQFQCCSNFFTLFGQQPQRGWCPVKYRVNLCVCPSVKVIQQFVIIMYSKHLSLDVNHARIDMFFKKKQDIEKIPPTSNALLQHAKRAVYQTGVWGLSLESNQNLSSPTEFGCKNSVIEPNIPFEPLWFRNGEASQECREFIKCACNGAAGCIHCKCAIATLCCTMLCDLQLPKPL